MSRARLSIVVYGAYPVTAGLILALIPNVLLSLVGLPEAHDVWIRLCGSLALVLGAKGIQNSKAEYAPGFQFDVYTRTFVATFLVILVLIRMAPPVILPLAAVDYAGAVWTELALRADRRLGLPGASTVFEKTIRTGYGNN